MRIKHLLERSALLLAIVFTIIVITLSLIRVGELPVPKVSNIDKLEHTFSYLVLTFLWLFALGKTKTARLLIIINCILLGIIIEILQELLTNYRCAEFLDVVANTTGVLCAMLIFRSFFLKNKTKC
ncbi:MAG: hypothetical protein CR961_01260 [Polaribacter sp.]|nr:MAG: hypothetical protein CR961_01260 [Polaribacter sp.]